MISFDAEEFSKLYLFIAQANAILHSERDVEELNRFQKKYYPLLNDVLYSVLVPKIGDITIASFGEIDFSQDRSIDDILSDVKRALTGAAM